LSEGVTATGTAAKGTVPAGLAGRSIRLRLDMRLHYFKSNALPAQQDMAGVVLALITGDRALGVRQSVPGSATPPPASSISWRSPACISRCWPWWRHGWRCAMLRWVPGLGLLIPLHKAGIARRGWEWRWPMAWLPAFRYSHAAHVGHAGRGRGGILVAATPCRLLQVAGPCHAGRCCCGGRCPCMPPGSGCPFGAVALLTLIGQNPSGIEPVMEAGAMKLQLGTIRTALLPAHCVVF
jgi:hypothetical protein